MMRARCWLVALLAGLGMASVQAGDPVKGKEKSAMCAACHGADGNSASAEFPRLAGQYESYLVRALTDYKSGKRKNPIMMGMSAALSREDIADISAYFAAQRGLAVVRH